MPKGCPCRMSHAPSITTMSHFRISVSATARRNCLAGNTCGNRLKTSSAATVVSRQSKPPIRTDMLAWRHGVICTQSNRITKIILCVFSKYCRVAFICGARIIRGMFGRVNKIPSCGNFAIFSFCFRDVSRQFGRYSPLLKPHLARMPSSSSRLLYLRTTRPRPLPLSRMATG